MNEETQVLGRILDKLKALYWEEKTKLDADEATDEATKERRLGATNAYGMAVAIVLQEFGRGEPALLPDSDPDSALGIDAE
jgi:hypothetical protein